MKNDKLYYSISEVAKMLKLSPQTIRNWVNVLPQLKVDRSESGRRMFTMNNIIILKKIRKLRNDGYNLQAIKKYFSKRVDKNIESIIIAIDDLIKHIDRLIK